MGFLDGFSTFGLRDISAGARGAELSASAIDIHPVHPKRLTGWDVIGRTQGIRTKLAISARLSLDS